MTDPAHVPFQIICTDCSEMSRDKIKVAYLLSHEYCKPTGKFCGSYEALNVCCIRTRQCSATGVLPQGFRSATIFFKEIVYFHEKTIFYLPYSEFVIHTFTRMRALARTHKHKFPFYKMVVMYSMIKIRKI